MDHTNIGTAGIYASQIIPTSAAQATFGGAVGYTIYPAATGVVPLTVSGVSGQSADLFDVTLTNGGTKALYVTASGATNAGTGNASVAGDIGAGRTTSTGQFVIGGGSSYVTLDYGIGTAGTTTLTKSGSAATNFTLANGGTFTTTGGATLGSVLVNGSTATAFNLGTDGTNLQLRAYTASSQIVMATNTGGGYSPVTGGTYTTISDASMKKNVVPIADALATIAALKPFAYTLTDPETDDEQDDLGFIAQHVYEVLPQVTRALPNGKMGLSYASFAALNTAAIQEIAAKLRAAGIAGF